MKTKNTPAPWIASKDPKIPWGFQIWSERTNERNFSTWVASCRAGESPDENEYNSYLIAAAPEMLEVLEDILKTISPQLVPHEYDIVKNVIKKAKGEK